MVMSHNATSHNREVPQPTVTVVTVTFNAAQLIERTLLSVERQQYAPLETIVVDGGSTDGTLDIVRRHEGHITKWVSEPDGGIFDAMNKGVRMASGEWVIFLNAGDTFAAADVLARVFAVRRNAGILYGDVVKDGVVKKAPAHYRLYHRMLFCHQSALTRRQLLQDCPFDVRHRMSADLKFFLMQWQRHSRFEYVGMPIADFDTTGVSNARRSVGLHDNMRVMSEVVPVPQRWLCLLRLAVPYLMCRIKGK